MDTPIPQQGRQQSGVGPRAQGTKTLKLRGGCYRYVIYPPGGCLPRLWELCDYFHPWWCEFPALTPSALLCGCAVPWTLYTRLAKSLWCVGVYLFICIDACMMGCRISWSGRRYIHTMNHQLAWTLDFRVDFSNGVLLLRQEPDTVWRAVARGRSWPEAVTE